MAKTAGKTDKSDKKLLWKIHHWAGLYTGMLIGILSLTGALAVFIPEIDAWVLRVHYNASSSAPADGPMHFGRTVDSLIRAYPDYTSLAVSLPEKQEHVAFVDLAVRPDEASFKRYNFFVDAGTGRLLGHRDHQNSLANYLRQMHVRLYEGNWGRQLVGLGGIALVVLAVTGLLIYGNFMKKQRWPDFRKTANLRIRMADWHKLLGISALAFNLVIAITGAWLGLQPWLMRWFDISTPNTFKAPVVMEPAADRALSIDWDRALMSVQKEFPELEPRYLVPSTNGAGIITVRGHIRGLVYERNINTLVIDKNGYEALFKYDVRQQPFSHKFYFVQEALHFGDFGGLLLKSAYALLGLVSAFLSISGFIIYYYRINSKKQRKAAALKITFIWSVIIVLILVVIALISLFAGYSLAATVAAVIVNGTLAGLLLYALANYIRKRVRNTIASSAGV